MVDEPGGSPLAQLSDGPDAFVGRARDVAALAGAAGAALDGKPAVVMIEGEAGIGKTALVRRFAAHLPGFTVWQASCDAAETDLPYGVVTQLLRRLDPALFSSFAGLAPLVAAGATSSRIGASLVELIGKVQAGSAIAVLIDDVTWMDQASLGALMFAFDRLCADRVLVVLTAAVPPGEEVPVAEAVQAWRRFVAEHDVGSTTRLRGLTPPDIEPLIRARPAAAAAVDAAELVARTGGNPLYIRALLAGSDQHTTLTPAESLDETVRRQVAALPPAARQLAEALAVLDGQFELPLVSEIAGVGDPSTAVIPLVVGGLVRAEQTGRTTSVELRHGMHRAAIYGALAPRRRSELHAAAAAVLEEEASWRHRVAAATTVDARLADRLERAARARIESGDGVQAATYLRWAANLSSRRDERERRLLLSIARLQANRMFTRAETLRPAAERCAPCPLRGLVLGVSAMNRGLFATAEVLLGDAVRDGTVAQQEVAAMAGVALARLHVWQGSGRSAIDTARRVLALPGLDPSSAEAATYHLLCGHLHLESPRQALRELSGRQDGELSPALLTWRAMAGVLAGDLTAAIADATASASGPGIPEVALFCLSAAQYLTGAWDDSAISAEQAVAVATAENKVFTMAYVHTTAGLVAAGRGEWVRARGHVEASHHWVETIGPPTYAVFPAITGAVLAQARGDHPGMRAELEPVMSDDAGNGWRHAFQSWWRPLAVEALIGCGRLDAAERELGELAATAVEVTYLRTATAWLSGWLAQERGDALGAREYYEQGLADPDPIPLHAARLEQQYGRALALTREHQRGVTLLERAHRRYTELGAHPFARRCEDELVAAGRPEPSGGPDPLATLSSRERAVAHLIATGLTYRETAAELTVTVKTIEYHVGNVYAKLGISSRRQLRDALPTRPRAPRARAGRAAR